MKLVRKVFLLLNTSDNNQRHWQQIPKYKLSEQNNTKLFKGPLVVPGLGGPGALVVVALSAKLVGESNSDREIVSFRSSVVVRALIAK